MLLFILAYLAGALTILSPCILPVLPFVFAGSKGNFKRGALPLLLGMIVTFAVVSALGLIGGAWIGKVNDWGRILTLVFMTLFGFSLIFPELLQKFLAPLTRFGNRLGSQTVSGETSGPSPSRSFAIGIGTGLLWAPCAGPILGLIITGAAAQSDLRSSVLLLVAYGFGASCSLALALGAGGRASRMLRRFLGVEEVLRKVGGGLVLLGVLAIAFHWDRGILTQLSAVRTDAIEKRLIGIFDKNPPAASSGDFEGEMPELNGPGAWINSAPLSKADLKGKVVVVDFWTYSCINCLRTLPYVKMWAEKYKSSGLVIIGVHTPEFGFEKDLANVQDAVKNLGVTYPVVQDNDFGIWRRFKNQYWPAHYFVDRSGRIRHHHFGEGSYDESEATIRKLLAEDGTSLPAVGEAPKAEVPRLEKSPETYLGYARAENFVSKTPLEKDTVTRYEAALNLKRNQWSLGASWKVGKEQIRVGAAHAFIRFRFIAKDLHLVLGSGTGKSLRFKVTLDGKPLGRSHGVDTDDKGEGLIREHRLYNLIHQTDEQSLTEHSFEIEFLDQDAEAFAFTFG
ncbi:MAG: cytochrome c biogenesis protein DipZ [Bdellovibrionota bacterium]